MKIAFDHQIFGLQEYGGISRYFYELASVLAGRCAQNVSVISPTYLNRYLDNVRTDFKLFGVFVSKGSQTAKISRVLNSFFTPLLIAYLRPDIVHETYYSSKKIAPKKTKVVLTVFDMIHEKFSEHFSSADPTSQQKALAVARADHVICISEQTRQDLIQILNVDPAKTSVVYLGFSLTKGNSDEGHPLALERPFLLYVGSRGGYKNFERLLQARAASASLKKDFDLVCFGGGVFSQAELEMIQSLGFSENSVRQIAGDDALLARYYREARAFVYPSLYEGFGIPPLEAMSFDCPVVCSDVSSIPEVVGDAGEMFNPYSIDSMSHALERVVNDDALRQLLIARGRERIKFFSWDRCAEETMSIYRRVLA